MSDDRVVSARICIDAHHPSLPGHFPGNPVVPGVVLLDHVAAALERAGSGSLRRLTSVKFLAPVLPGQTIQLRATRQGTRVRFDLERDGSSVMSGEGELA